MEAAAQADNQGLWMQAGPLSSLFRERAEWPSGTKPIAMFLGAGMDIAAGGMTFQALKAEVVSQARSIPHLGTMEDILIDDLFQKIIDDELENEDRGGIVSGAFRRLNELTPSEGHLLVALLARQGAIDRVVTTNFDTLIEKAEAEIGERIFQVYAPGLAQPDMKDGEPLISPRPAYIKLHGDLDVRRVTHLSRDEIEHRAYEQPIAALLKQTFSTHRVFFIGYSGYDHVVAKVIRDAGGLGQVCYWVNPFPPNIDAPVVREIGSDKIKHVASKSDAFMRAIVKEALSRTDLLVEPNVFIESLVSERIKRANARFLASHDKTSVEDRAKLLQPRPSVDAKIAAFRKDRSSSLALLVGPSGVGKSTIAVRLCDGQDKEPFPSVLAIAAKSMIDTDVASRILSELETGSGRSTLRLFDFSAWLAVRRLDLLVIIDGLNEFSQDTENISRFLRAVIDALYRVTPHRRLKILVSLREETWSEVLPLLDIVDLKRVLWSTEGADDDSVSVISVGLFDEKETKRAFEAYARKYRADAAWRATSLEMRRMIADPFVLKEVMTTNVPLSSSMVSRELMGSILRSKLGKKLSSGRVEALMEELTQQVKASGGPSQINVSSFDLAEIGLLLDTNILQHTSRNRYQFFHDRTYEFFLARALENDWPIADFEDLASELKRSKDDRHRHAALLSCFVAPDPSIQRSNHQVLQDAVFVLEQPTMPQSDVSVIKLFVTDLLAETARQNPRYLVDVLSTEAFRSLSSSGWYARRLVRAAVLLPDDEAYAIWMEALKAPKRELQIEAEILLYDRVANRITERGARNLELLKAEPIRQFFYPSMSSPVIPVARILLLASRLGPDNLSRIEWANFVKAVRTEVNRLVQEIDRPKSLEDRKALAAPFVGLDDADANRFLFNAKASWLDTHFQGHSRVNAFKDAIVRLETGEALSTTAFFELAEHASLIGEFVDFIALNLLCALSYRTDRKGTLAAFHSIAAGFGPTTPAELIDLFLSCLFVSIALNGENAFQLVDTYTRQLVSRCPQMYLVNPGEVRCQRHGRFLDDFDLQFEDGFNPLAFYFYHAPSSERREVSFRRSLETDATAAPVVPLYAELLDRFERNRQGKGIIRIVHALGQMVSVWPYRGLDALAPLTGRQEPTVRRAVKRVLAEAYARFPVDCELMLERVGTAFSSDDLYEIRCADDPRLSQRTLEQTQWCRILITAESCIGKDFTWSVLKALVNSGTWWEAMSDIIVAALPAQNSHDDKASST